MIDEFEVSVGVIALKWSTCLAVGFIYMLPTQILRCPMTTNAHALITNVTGDAVGPIIAAGATCWATTS